MSTLTLQPAAPTSRSAPPRPRMAMLDAARFAAAAAIVWLHAPHVAALDNSRAVGRFAVPFFVMATVLMVFQSIGRNPSQDWRPYAWSRFLRLYLPFMAWNGIYVAFKLVKGRLLPGEPNDYPGIEILWAGACWHLWFLPFILVVSLLAFAAAKSLHARPEYGPWMAAAALFGGWLLMFWPSPAWCEGVSEYCEIVANALPAVAWGIALAVAWRLLGSGSFQRPSVPWLGALLLVASLAAVWLLGRSRVFETLAGLGMLLVALAPWEGRVCRLAARLGPLTLGIYLAHVLWLKVIEAVAAKAGVPAIWPRDVAIFLAALAASIFTAWLLARRPATRWLVA